MPETDFGECKLCGSTGMVSVPNLRSLNLGQWTTQVVLCPCAMGRWVGNRQHGAGPNGEPRGPSMGLAAYEAQCPNWRMLLAQHEAECVRELRAKWGQSHSPLDDALNAIADRVRDMREG